MSDLIDREYAIKRFCEDGTYLERIGVTTMTLCEAKQRAVDLIESFPSVAEIVSCKDCKHWYSDADTGMACEFTNMGQSEDGYCNWAERRSDE